MWTRLGKELRGLVPSWNLVLVFSLLVFLAGTTSSAALATMAFAFLCFLPASSLFGAEFDERTWPNLLAQPIPRSRIWWEKMLVGIFVVTVCGGLGLVASWLVGWRTGEFFRLPAAWIPLIALATAPTLSLWLRDSLRTLWASLVLPIVFYQTVAISWAVFSGPQIRPPSPALILIPYCVLMTVVGYRRFLGLEVVSGENLSVAQLPGEKRRTTLSADRANHLIRELICKEVRLQRASLLLIPIAVACWFVLWLLSFQAELRLASGGTLGDWVVIAGYLPSAVLILVVPAVLGAGAVASERQLGVIGWQLGLPVSLRLQWRLKVGIGLCSTFLSGFLGLVLGWVLITQRLALGDSLPNLLASLGIWPLFAFAVGLYGSRHGRNPFQSLSLAFVMGLGLLYLWKLMVFTAYTADILWPLRLGPFLHLGDLRLGGLVDLIMGLLIFTFLWAVPSQEDWILGTKLERSVGLRMFVGLVFATVCFQALVLSWAGRELDREIAAKDSEIEALGDLSSLAWVVEELDPLVEELNVDYLAPNVDEDIHVALHEDAVNASYWTWRQPLSRFVNLAVWVEGVDVGSASLERWFWRRNRQGSLDSAFPDRSAFAESTRVSDVRRHWRAVSIAPLWFSSERRQQVKQRVRQNIILEAARISQHMARQLASDPEGSWAVDARALREMTMLQVATRR